MKAIELLVEDYKTTAARFATQGGSQQDITARIQRYRELLARNQIRDANQKQIDWWAKQGWEAFDAFVKGFEGHVTATQVKRRKLVGDSIILKETNDWLVVIPLDKEASCFHGKNSDWCVTKPQHPYWEEYFHDSKIVLIYILGKNGQGMWALAGHPDGEIEIFNQRDDKITNEELKAKTGFSADAVMNDAMARYGKRIQKAQVGPAAAVEAWLNGQSDTRNAEIERDVIRSNDPELAIRYIHRVTKAHGAQSWPDRLMELAFTIYVPSDQPDDVEDDEWEDPRDALRYRWGKKIQEILELSTRIPPKVEEIILKNQPRLAKFMPSISPEFANKLALRVSDMFEYLYGKNLVSRDTMLAALKKWPTLLSKIKDPDLDMQKAAISGTYGSATSEILRKMPEVDPEIQLLAIANNPDSIHSIKNPTKEAMIAAVEKNPNLIGSLAADKVDEDVLKTAFKKSWVSSQYLPKDKDNNPIPIPPGAQVELAKSFFRDYLKYGDSMQNSGYRTGMLKYHYPTVEKHMTTDRTKRFLAALRKKYEKD